jgi:four helix bundle protein
MYDLEERTFQFAADVRVFVKQLPRTVCNNEDVRQNEALSKKDFKMRINISRKESKESRYWLRLLDTHSDPRLEATRDGLMQEATELMKIFGAILQKSG